MKNVFLVPLFFFLQLSAFADEVALLTARRQAQIVRSDVILKENKEIRYNTFIFELDDAGKEVIGQLVDARRRGVEVKLIIDGINGGLAKNPAVLQALEKMGIQIKVFNPVFRHPLNVNLRNHQKSLIASDKMIIGGRNTSADYFDSYIDTEVMVKGKEVKTAAQHFDDVFNSPEVKKPLGYASNAQIDKAAKEINQWVENSKKHINNFPEIYTKVEKATYYADPSSIVEKRANGINKQIVSMIDRAEKTLSFVNPYVYLSPEVKEAFERAIKRGVKIRIGTNSKDATDSLLAGIAWEVKKGELVNMGIEVHESRQYVHAKTIVRDAEEVFIGSFNMDMRSHNLNLENGIFIKSPKIAKTIESHHRRLVKYFMDKVEHKIEEKVKTNTGKAAHCIRSGFHKILTDIAFPHL
jgi:phosphatidylserine/phosphatidylglycerophosphate/cardiolipin synthase-like enzyme